MKKKLKDFVDYVKDKTYYQPDKITKSDNSAKTSEEGHTKLHDDDLKQRTWAIKSFKTRRSIRRFSHKPVDWKIIYEIIDGALNAPCAGNVQNYDVIVIEDKLRKHEISKIEAQQYWLAEAPYLLVVVRDNSRLQELYIDKGFEYSIQNSAAFIENILMLVHMHDLGACWVNAGDNGVLKEYLGVEGKDIDAVIPIGYPLEEPKVLKCETADKIFYEKYGNRKRI